MADSRSLFTTRDGAPMRFYIRPGPSKRQLAPLITHGGGVVCRIQEPGAFLLADPSEGQLGPGYISTNYITDSVRSNRSLSPRPYCMISLRDLRMRKDQRKSPISKLTSVRETPGTGDCTENPNDNVEASTTSLTTTEGATGERGDNVEKRSTAPRKSFEIEKGHLRTSTRRRTIAKASSEEDLKPVKSTTLSTGGTSMEEATADEKDHKNAGEASAYSSSSGGEQNPSSTKMDVEQTLNQTSAHITFSGGQRNSSSKKMDVEQTLNKSSAYSTSSGDENNPSSTKMDVEQTLNKTSAYSTSPGGEQNLPSTKLDGEDLKPEKGTALSTGGTSMEEATADEKDHKNAGEAAAYSTSSGGQKNPSSTKMDVEQTLNKIAAYSTSPGDEQNLPSTKLDVEQTLNKTVAYSSSSGGQRNSSSTKMDVEQTLNKTAAYSTSSGGEQNLPSTKMAVEQTLNKTSPSSTSSRGQRNSSSTKMNVEQTLNEDVNYSMLVIPEPRSSTPALGNSVEDLEADTANVSVLIKDDESPLEFLRPKRRVSGRLMLNVGETQRSPKLNQKRAKEQMEQHSQKLKRTEGQTDQHSPKQKEADENSPKQKGAEEQTDEHSPKQKRAEEHTDQHSPKQKRAEEHTDQYSPNTMQNLTKKQKDTYKKAKDETQMSLFEEHCDQDVPKSPTGRAHASNLEGCGNQDQGENQLTEEGHNAEVQVGQFAKTETGAQEMDEQSAESCQIQSSVPPQSHKASAGLRRGRMAFTKEEDMVILLYIRDNVSSSRTVTGNALWVEMEKKKVLNRTWQAMKSRYGKYLTYQKHKYKLPPKIPSAPTVYVDTPEKGKSMLPVSSADNLLRDDAMLTSAATDDPQKSDTALPYVSSDSVQNCPNPVVLGASTESPQKGDAALSSVSLDRTQKCKTLLQIASFDTSQMPDAMPPSDSSDCAQKCTKMHRASSEGPRRHATLLPIASSVDPQKRVIMLPMAYTNDPQKCDTLLPITSTDDPQKRDTLLPITSSNEPQKCDSLLPIASTDDPQKRNTSLPIVSTEHPQKRDTLLPIASTEDPQKPDTLLPIVSTNDPQKGDTLLPIASTEDPQKRDTLLPVVSTEDPQKRETLLPIVSTDEPQKRDALLPIASTDDLQKCDTIPPLVSAVDPQKRSTILPGSSADNPQSNSTKPHGADTLVPNIASKKQTTLTPKKRSSKPPKVDEPSPRKKGYKMLPPSEDAALPDQEDSGDSEGLHIFERANMEFEETDDNSSPDLPVSQTKDINKKNASPVEERPSMSQASESEDLREAMADMMNEFKINLFQATQALFFNNGELGSTRHFLHTGARPDGYPIWEPKDDLDLKKNNPKLPSHLITKYGADNVAKRAAFLAS